MIKVLTFLVLVCLGGFVVGDRDMVGARGKMLGPLILNLDKPGEDAHALLPMNKYVEKLGGDEHTIGPTNTFLEKLGPRALRANPILELHCKLRLAQAYVVKLTSFVVAWLDDLVALVSRILEKECGLCLPFHELLDVAEDTEFSCTCGRGATVSVWQCACCVRIERLDILICVAAGFIIHNTTLFLAVTVEDQVLISWKYKIRIKFLKYLLRALSCIPLPPPISFMSGCLTPSFDTPSAETNYTWQICVSLEVAMFQIPVLTLYTKCFSFGGNSDEMIEGPNPRIGEKEPPGTVVVHDKENVGSLVCLTNKEKSKALERARSGEAEHTIDKTGRTNWKESEPKDIPPYLAVLFIKGTVSVDDLLKSDGARFLSNQFPRIDKMLYRTKKEKWLNNSASRAWEQQALSCGGVLLTKNKVLTICACVRSFYVLHKLDRQPRRDIFPYDLTALEVFMEIPGVFRTGDQTYQLDTDPDKFMTESLCARRLEVEESWGLSSLMMVMAFLPEIADPKPGQFVNWPPDMVNKREQVKMIAFGFQEVNQTWVFRNPAGDEINFHKQAVNFNLKECPMTTYIKSELLRNKSSNDPGSFDARSRISGFCARAEEPSELCEGKLGYPLVAGAGAGRNLRGLVALPVNCRGENSIAGAIFNEDVIGEVDSYLERTGSVSPNDSVPRLSVLLASVLVTVFRHVFRYYIILI